MKRFVILILFLWTAMVACQTEYKVRKLVSKVDSVDRALELKEKYSKWDIVIHKLDSETFFNHRVYARLSAGNLLRIGKGQSDEADLYKLLSPARTENDPTDNFNYYVLQIHLK